MSRWRQRSPAAVAFNFASQRLNISLPQVAMQNSARGYIPPEQWDEGIPAALLNYSFTGNRGSEDDSYYLNLQSGLNYGARRLRNNGARRYTQNNGQRHSNWQNIGTGAAHRHSAQKRAGAGRQQYRQ